MAKDTEIEDDDERNVDENPDEGVTMSQAGAMPAGSEMGHWNTANPRPDATKPETMPGSAKKRKD
ncbi:MAG: hypothetical protein ACRD0Q_07400 [Acidimicrobiales bacterium]